jgi:hypothetical protein
MPLTRREQEIGKAMRAVNTIWLVTAATDSNEPAPSILGAWLTKQQAEQEQTRLQQAMKGYLIEIDEYPLNTPWSRYE